MKGAREGEARTTSGGKTGEGGGDSREVRAGGKGAPQRHEPAERRPLEAGGEASRGRGVLARGHAMGGMLPVAEEIRRLGKGVPVVEMGTMPRWGVAPGILRLYRVLVRVRRRGNKLGGLRCMFRM